MLLSAIMNVVTNYVVVYVYLYLYLFLCCSFSESLLLLFLVVLVRPLLVSVFSLCQEEVDKLLLIEM